MRLGVGMDGVGVVERGEGLLAGGESESMEDPLGWSLEGLRMLRGATSGNGWGEAERRERGPMGLAGLGCSDCIVSDGEDDGRGLKLATVHLQALGRAAASTWP